MRSLRRSALAALAILASGAALTAAVLPAFAALTLIVAGAAPAVAQGTIIGTLYDSLRANRRLTGATVSLYGTTREVRTDSLGRFRFDSVPEGRQTVAYWAPWLDSLALEPVSVSVNVYDRFLSPVALTTPSRVGYQRAVCGAPMDKGDAILLGRVRAAEDRAPVEGATVEARWIEMQLRAPRVERVPVQRRATSDGEGLYVLCGVPADDAFDLQVALGATRSGMLLMEADAAPVAVWRDLLVARGTGTGLLRGTVRDSAGRPLAGASIEVATDRVTRSARSDSLGRFAVTDAPLGTQRLVARRLGSIARELTVDVTPEPGPLLGIELRPLPRELDRVLVTGRVDTPERRAFDERRMRGSGYFLDDSTLARLRIRNSAEIAMRFAPARVSQGSMLMRGRAGGQCRPRFFLDGLDWQPQDVREEEDFYRRAKRIEMHLAAMAPPEFRDPDGCGVVLIWTR